MQEPRGRRGREEGVAEIVGSLLMVGLTVSMMGLAFAALLVLPETVEVPRASLEISVEPGPDGDWDTGDEVLVIAHRGGEPLDRGTTVISYAAPGGTQERLEGASLGGPFADGALTIGERWSVTLRAAAPDDVRTSVVARDALIAGGGGGGMPAGDPCAGDFAPPTVLAWQQVPPDLTTAVGIDLALTVTLEDACGLAATMPSLGWRFLGEGSDSTLPMVASGPASWSASIPDAPWYQQGGRTLVYRALGMTDARGNVGDSPAVQELIERVGVARYVAGAAPAPGVVADFPNAQSAADGAAEARVLEVNTASAAERNVSLNASVAAANPAGSGSAWVGPEFADVGDDNWAHTNDTANPGAFTLRLAPPPADVGVVSSVVLRAEVGITVPGGGLVNDKFRLRGCTGPSIPANCTGPLEVAMTDKTDTMMTFNITTLKPGAPGQAWTAADLALLQVYIEPVKVGGRDGSWRVDLAEAEVNYTRAPAFESDVRFDVTAVPDGPVRWLELRYRASGDAFRVFVEGSAGWRDIGLLDQAGPLDWTAELNADEWGVAAPGVVRVRMVGQAASPVQGVLALDWLRVTTVVLS